MNFTDSVLDYKCTLVGHTDMVTSISTPCSGSNIIISASRDKKLILWELNEGPEYGRAKMALHGHSGAVQDVEISSDGMFALSGSWDHTMRLWDLNKGKTVRSFKGHTSDVFSLAFSADNRQIVSGSRDKTIKLWNTLADCKFTIQEHQHTDWVSCVKFSPSAKQPVIVSCGWDKLIKVWNLNNCKLKTNLAGHTGPLYSVTISPDGSLCASGGKDGVSMLWDVNDGKHLYSLEAQAPINTLCFSPCNYWLCAGTSNSVKIWDLENKNVLAELAPEKKSQNIPTCTSLAWSNDGKTLFLGSGDGQIHIYEVSSEHLSA